MLELWLVRHGQTDWNIEGRFQGQADVPLNAAGRAQAQQLSQELAEQDFVAVYSSDLVRARETAEILAAPHHMPVQVDSRLREIHQGEWEGMPGAEVVKRFGLDPDMTKPRSLHFRAPGGESVCEVAERVGEALEDIHETHPRGAVLVVSHAVTTAVVACQAQGISLDLVRSVLPRNAVPVRVEWPCSNS